MDYTTYEPGAELAGFVKCYWTLENSRENQPQKQRILPDGCMELIFHYGDLYRQYRDGNTAFIQPRSFVFGQVTKPLDIEPTGETGIFAVRFLPDGFMPFATIPIAGMENRAVPLAELFGNAGNELENAVLGAANNTQRMFIVSDFLQKRLLAPGSVDQIIKSSVQTLIEGNGQVSVAELSEQLNVNRRQLERKFASVIGLSPKQLSKIIRLQTTIKLLAARDFESLTAIAYEGSYYDQAHFIRDFKEFTGMSPKKFYTGNLQMASLFADLE